MEKFETKGLKPHVSNGVFRSCEILRQHLGSWSFKISFFDGYNNFQNSATQKAEHGFIFIL